MKALQFISDPLEPQMKLADVPKPVPQAGHVLVQVFAAGIMPTELQWYSTSHNQDGSQRKRPVPGHEFSGVVAGVGPNVTDFVVGHEVYGMNDWFDEGAMAEFCLAEAPSIAHKPRSLTHAEAASVPISALTAWQGLFVHGKLQSGERLLVHGGAGAVGAYIIQLAKLHGAEVITTASGDDVEFLRLLGADAVIDYKTVAFEDKVPEVDMVFDTVGGATLQRSWKVLKPSGRLFTVQTSVANSTDEREKNAFFIVEPSQQQLADIAVLLDGDVIKTFVGATTTLPEAGLAYAGKVHKQRGKVVMVAN